jgi:hypothetical protein
MSQSEEKFMMLDAFRISDRPPVDDRLNREANAAGHGEKSFHDFHVNYQLDYQVEFADEARADINCCLDAQPLITCPVAISPFDDDYFRGNLPRCSYFLPYLDYVQDYLPAYRLGHEARLGQPIHSLFEQFEHEIEVQWHATFKHHSRLDWDQARAAASDAWYRVTEFTSD